MTTFTSLLVLLVAFALLGLVTMVYRAGDTLDVAGPFRDRALARAARKLAAEQPYPDTVDRSYWRASDYVRDSQRLKALGYRVTSESITEPFITHQIPGRGGGRTIKRRVPMCHITYGRAPKPLV
jgi:hypothetical protein